MIIKMALKGVSTYGYFIVPHYQAKWELPAYKDKWW